MAKVDVYSIFSTSCSVRLLELDTEWEGGDRKVYYRVLDEDDVVQQTITTTLTGAPSEGGYASITGLSPSTTYTILCTVFNSQSQLLATIRSDSFTTNSSSSGGIVVDFGGIYVVQPVRGVKKANVFFEGTNLTGATYYITVYDVDTDKWWPKASGVIDEDVLENGVEIEFDDYGEFGIGCSLVIGETTFTSDDWWINIREWSSSDGPVSYIEVTQNGITGKYGSLFIYSPSIYITKEEGFDFSFFQGADYELEVEPYAGTYYDGSIDMYVTMYDFSCTQLSIDKDYEEHSIVFTFKYTYGSTEWNKVTKCNVFYPPDRLDALHAYRYNGYIYLTWSRPTYTAGLTARYSIYINNKDVTTNIPSTEQKNDETLTADREFQTTAEFGQDYTCEVELYYRKYQSSSYRYSWYNTVYWTGISAPPRPVLKSISSNGTLVSGSWGLKNTLVDKYLSNFHVYISLYPKDGSEPIATYESVGAISGDFQFQNIPSGEYEIRASSVIFPEAGGAVWSVIDSGDKGEENNGDYKYILTQDITVNNSIIVGLWDWDASNGTASNLQVQNAYSAINKVGGFGISDFSYLVWNDLVDKTYSAAQADNGEWLTAKSDGSATYLSYDETMMTSDDRTLTADRFNALKFNIGAPTNSPGTGIDDVSSGDVVYGWYFTTLTSALNTWINNING